MELRERINQVLAGEGENYIFPFFWQHGEEEAVLREYMGKIQEANIGAVCVESRPHPAFGKERWWKDMDVILDEAARRGMKVWILDDEHFPTGYAAGAVENADKELCHWYLDYNALESYGPRPQMEIPVASYAKPQPLPPWMPPMPGEPKRKHGDDRLFRVIACPVEARGKIGVPLDLTGMVEDGRLIWDVPAGYWKIYVIYLTYDARGRNNYINFLDEASCRLLVDAVYEPHYAHYGELFGTVIAGFFSDEPPVGNTPGYTRGDLIGNPEMALAWSAAVPAAMEKEFGDGWETEIPYLWNEGSDGHRTARIRTAYMNVVSKLVARCFSGQLGQWCEAHGVEYIGHMLEDCDSNANLGPSMGHFFRGLSGQHMAGIDNIGGQVLPGGQNVHRHEPDMCQDSAGFYHYMLGRMGASMAAIDSKKAGRCMCENFGAYGWRAGVGLEKYLTDHFLARGVNRFVPHAFSPKEFPDPDCPPHFYAHGKNPQFQAFGALMAYTNRVCHLIDGGKADAPVALLYHGESQWAGAYESNIHACRVLTENQINFLLIPADVFEEGGAAEFSEEEGLLRIGSTECRAFVVSGCAYITKAAAEFAVRAKKAGFCVLFTGRLPEGVSDVDGETSRKLIGALADAKTVPVEDLADTLADSALHTVVPEKKSPRLTAYHYRNGEELYLLLNEDPGEEFCQWVALSQTAGGTSKSDAGGIWIYDAWENRMKPARVRDGADGIEVWVSLQPLELMVFVCGLSETTPAQEEADQMPEEPTEERKLERFTVTRCTAEEYPAFGEPEEADFVRGMGAAHPDFSGFFRYETTVTLQDWRAAELLLSEVFDSAEVFVNGQSVGIRAAKPYRFAVGNLLRNGENTIRIEVATTLERLAAASGIGDGGMGASAPLAPTGLIGAVRLVRFH